MQNISNFEKVLLKSGIDYQSNKVIDDYLLTGNPESVRDIYRCCQNDIADKMISLLEMKDNLSVLEPSAGKGMILKKILHYKNHSYCEINTSFIMDYLCKLSDNFEKYNFLYMARKFDRIIMNPPFSFKEYEKHIVHGYSLLEKNGIMVFLYPKTANYLQGKDVNFKPLLEISEQIEVGKVCGDCECVIGKLIKK